MLKKDVIKNLLAVPGNSKFNANVSRVSVIPNGNSTRIAIGVDSEVNQMVLQADGSYAIEKTATTIFTSLYDFVNSALAGGEYSFAINWLIENPKAAEAILAGATVTVIEDIIEAGVTVSNNPFSNAPSDYTPEHQQVRHWVVDIDFSEMAKQALSAVYMKMMGL